MGKREFVKITSASPPAMRAWAALGGVIERTPGSFYHYCARSYGHRVDNYGMCPESAAKGAVAMALKGPCSCKPGSDCYGNGGSHGPRSAESVLLQIKGLIDG